jgi:hypothetical protein
MMEAVSSFEMSVKLYRTTRRHIPEESSHCYENLESKKNMFRNMKIVI